MQIDRKSSRAAAPKSELRCTALIGAIDALRVDRFAAEQPGVSRFGLASRSPRFAYIHA
jgi:hypothetical protein